uniref:Uncharacterized protein n=2 Tax=Guillardia theta (strain CCMP2712) TaxID=905079 RepID=A0A0C3UE88_GUITC
MQASKLGVAVLTCACALFLLSLLALPLTRSYSLLMIPIAPVQILYGGSHWGGVGSEGYGTSAWDNSGWNAHYHPRDGASMDSESMEPYTWRKGPRVNDEYTGVMASGDPTVDPPDSWEPPINFKKSRKQLLLGESQPPKPMLVSWNDKPLRQQVLRQRDHSSERSRVQHTSRNPKKVFLELYGGSHW